MGNSSIAPRNLHNSITTVSIIIIVIIMNELIKYRCPFVFFFTVSQVNITVAAYNKSISTSSE